MKRFLQSRVTWIATGILATLGCGLWMQHQILVTSARWTSGEQTWQSLGRHLQQRLIAKGTGEESRFDATHQTDWSTSDPQFSPHQITSALVTPTGLVQFEGAPPHTASRDGSWSYVRAASGASQGELQFGGVQEGGRTYPAVVQGHSSGSPRQAVVLAIPLSELHARAVQDHLGLSNLLAFCWIGLLQCGLIVIVFFRAQSQESKRNNEQIAQTRRNERDLSRTRDAVIFGLAKLAESRDPDTGLHLERITLYSKHLAIALRRHPKFASVITPAFIRLIEFSAALHDIGKVGVEDSILLKPGRLDTGERQRMQIHPVVGGNCILEIEKRLGSSNFLEMAREIAMHHHEWWDGTGYPSEMKGTNIPLSARIVAVADVYDALSSRRAYKQRFSHERCVEMIVEESGTHFDPDIVNVFLQIQNEFREIAENYRDGSSTEAAHGATGKGSIISYRADDGTESVAEPGTLSVSDPLPKANAVAAMTVSEAVQNLLDDISADVPEFASAPDTAATPGDTTSFSSTDSTS